MASLDDLYAVSRRLCFDISDGLTRLERDEARGVARNEALGREMRARIGELKRITSEMERQWRSMAMTASISKSDMWKVRRSMRRGALEGMNSTDASVVASLFADLDLLAGADAFVGTSASWISRLALLAITGEQAAMPPYEFLDAPLRSVWTMHA